MPGEGYKLRAHVYCKISQNDFLRGGGVVLVLIMVCLLCRPTQLKFQ